MKPAAVANSDARFVCRVFYLFLLPILLLCDAMMLDPDSFHLEQATKYDPGDVRCCNDGSNHHMDDYSFLVGL